MNDTPRMRSAKKIYEDMLNAPTRPSTGHTSKAMDMADKMFAPEKKAKGGYVKAADGCAQRGKTKGRIV
jgi:hypothetical protein